MNELRQEIDSIDAQLLKLIDHRMELAYEIGLYKKEAGTPVYVPQREQEIFDRLKVLPKERISDSDVEELFALILEIGRRYGSKAIGS